MPLDEREDAVAQRERIKSDIRRIRDDLQRLGEEVMRAQGAGRDPRSSVLGALEKMNTAAFACNFWDR